MNILLILYIPIIATLLWAIWQTKNRGSKNDAAALAVCGSIVTINAFIRHFVISGCEPSNTVIITQQLLSSLIIPFAYLYFAMQVNVKLVNSCSITLFSLIALLMFPNINIVTATDPSALPLDAILPPSSSALPAVDGGASISWQGSATLLREMTACKTLNIIADTTIYQYTIADLVIALQAIVTTVRAIPLIRKLKSYGLQLSHDVKIFTAWWASTALFAVFSSLYSDTNHIDASINVTCHIAFMVIMVVIFYLLGRGINFQPEEIIEEAATVPADSSAGFTVKSKDMAAHLTTLINEKHIHLRQGYSVDDAIDELRTNRTYFYRMVKDEFGCTFTELMNRERIKEIERQLVATNESISTISSRCGFKNTSYMIKIFKQLEGCTPAEWKKQHQ